jgi:hypothetical protein
MSSPKWVIVTKVSGELQGELLRGLLQAQGIEVNLVQEGAARAIGITAGPLGEVEIMVPESQLQEAQDVIRRFRRGDFGKPDRPER